MKWIIAFLLFLPLASYAQTAGVNPPSQAQAAVTGKILQIDNQTILVALSNGKILQVHADSIAPFLDWLNSHPTDTVNLTETGMFELPYRISVDQDDFFLEEQPAAEGKELWQLVMADPTLYQLESRSNQSIKLKNRTGTLDIALNSPESLPEIAAWEPGDQIFYIKILAHSTKKNWKEVGYLAFRFHFASEALEWLGEHSYAIGVWVHPES